MIALLDAILQRGIAPALVDRCPSDDACVIDVALDSFHPLGVESLDVFLVEFVGIGHLRPDEVSQSVRPVEEDGVFDLLVLAASVEAHLF